MDLSKLRARYLLAVGVTVTVAPMAGSCASSSPDVDEPGSASTVAAVGDGEAIVHVESSVVPLPTGELCPAPPPASSNLMLNKRRGGCSVQPVGCVAALATAPPQHFPEPYDRCPLVHPTSQGARLAVEATRLARETSPDQCCYVAVIRRPAGRPLRDGAAVLVAPQRAGAGWLRDDVQRSGPADPTTRRRLAEHWLQGAATEHASVASFARFSLQLMALGAPPELLIAAHRAALDEIEHARVLLSLAAELGRVVEPGALPLAPQPTATFAALAAETFLDGCVHETIGAVEARRSADACRDPRIAAQLERIACDEERHAELAWRALRWAVAEGGADAVTAVRGVWQALPLEIAIADHDTASGLSDHGVLDAAERRAIRAAVLEDVVRPCLAAILERASRAREKD